MKLAESLEDNKYMRERIFFAVLTTGKTYTGKYFRIRANSTNLKEIYECNF